MAASAEKIQKLKLILGEFSSPPVKDHLPSPAMGPGIPRGVLVELCGSTPILWLMHFLAQNPKLRTFWIEKKSEVLPTALQQRGVDLRNVTFARLTDDLKKPLRRVIQSQAYDVIIAPNDFKEDRTLRAFQLLNEKANSVFFLLAQKKISSAWPISLQLQISANKNEEFQVEVLRQKYGGGAL